MIRQVLHRGEAGIEVVEVAPLHAVDRQQEMQAHLSQDAYELLSSLFATYESLHDAALDDRTALLKIWATKPVRQEAAKTV